MPREWKIAYFAHSLRSDWNNGNAHFLRGLMRGIVKLGHDVTVFEGRDNWSASHLRAESRGVEAQEAVSTTYPELRIETYDEAFSRLDQSWYDRLAEVDVVMVHEWNPPALLQELLRVRDELKFRIVFHDTHHRASSSPEEISNLGVERCDGVVVFGESLRDIYLRRFGLQRVWVLHEAADVSIFRPFERMHKRQDVVWVGNWGDEERSAEIGRFLLEPASILCDRRFTVYGVRYPEDGLRALGQAGVQYGGYLPNLCAPMVYAESRLTVHIPRQQYVSAMRGVPTIRVFEALACGIPLITAPWADSEHLFREGDYLRVRDAGEMRRAMEYLLGDPQAAAAQAQRGLETVLAHHTCDHRAHQLMELFEEHLL